MKKIVFCAITAVLITAINVMPSFAGRYYAPHYYHHTPYYHTPYRHHHGIHGGDIWLGLGLGLLSGVVISSIAAPPPRPPAVVYTAAPPVIVQRPQIIQQTPYYSENSYSTGEELVLRQVITTAEVLNVRSLPDLQSDVVRLVKKNQVLNVIGAAPDWLYVRTADGFHGWVMSQYTQESSQPVG